MAADSNAAASVSNPFMGQNGCEERQNANGGEGWHVIACDGSLGVGFLNHKIEG